MKIFVLFSINHLLSLHKSDTPKLVTFKRNPDWSICVLAYMETTFDWFKRTNWLTVFKDTQIA